MPSAAEPEKHVILSREDGEGPNPLTTDFLKPEDEGVVECVFVVEGLGAFVRSLAPLGMTEQVD
jgi:hypothetical protein